VPRAIRTYGAERLTPGDGILINDPYLGGVHLNDITLITPVFHDGALLGYVANIAHHVDVGGGAPGSIGVSSEIYQEGLVIPPVRFVKGGQIDPDIFALIRSNFRGTREISGDFRAQTAANRLGAQRIEALVAQHGAATLTQYLDELLRYTERRTRAAFAEFPDGRFAAEMFMDGDGVTDEPVKLAAIVTIESGRVSVDLTGCDEQRKSPTNATSSQTYSGVVYVLKCLIDPDIPVNDGFYRLIDIRSRPGSVVHAQHPAAVAAGWEIAMQLCDLLFRALAPALPDRVVAGTKGCVCNIAFGGMNPTSGEYFTYYETIAGGYGATLTTDGMDAVQAHFQNTENAPVEETEANYPVRDAARELACTVRTADPAAWGIIAVDTDAANLVRGHRSLQATPAPVGRSLAGRPGPRARLGRRAGWQSAPAVGGGLGQSGDGPGERRSRDGRRCIRHEPRAPGAGRPRIEVRAMPARPPRGGRRRPGRPARRRAGRFRALGERAR
jgi:N-methylhydantoinase B/oxoprolinase/acetone carboxylase alpha subunit